MTKDNEELKDYIPDDELEHYGMPERSGRYPWGSGKNPYQSSGDFLSRYEGLRKTGLTDTEIAVSLGITTTLMRPLLSIARNEREDVIYSKINSLVADGYNYVQIASMLGLKGESTVRSKIASGAKAKRIISLEMANNLKDIVDSQGMIDIGKNVNRHLNISTTKMTEAIEILKMEGYEVWSIGVAQSTNPGRQTTMKMLCPPGTKHADVYDYDGSKPNPLLDYISRDGGDTFEPGFVYPSSLNSDRIQVRYAEDGGNKKDGLVEIRRGVDDISLGNSNYSQVRILVDGTHYIKGMAVHSDDLPKGVDIIFNTNKQSDVPKMDVLKKIKDDPINPFGSSIKEHGGQSYYVDENGKKHLSVINKRADEGDWGDWSRELSSQFLSKQPEQLIFKQLNMSMTDKQDEFDEINSLTNPTVKKALLISYANDCDASSVHLKAASLPGQVYKVILPLVDIKDNEIYAPTMQDGSEVALVRYPHGGTFEIPILKVNNRNQEGIQIMTKTPSDAVGINAKVAERMSGADFDGDTVMVIPLSNKVRIKSTNALKQLEGFDNKLFYGHDDVKIDKNGKEHYFRGGKEFSVMKDSNTQIQMGTISNLITDMTLGGAPDEQMAKAVKHSMVIIDAAKHGLDYKASEVDNDIKYLHKRYQSQVDPETGKTHMGSATLISKAKSQRSVPERKEGAFIARDNGNVLTLIDDENKIYLDEKTRKVYTEKEKRTLYIDPKTGEKLWHETGREYVKAVYKGKDGKNKKVSVKVQNGVLRYKDEDGRWVIVSDEKLIKKPALTKTTAMEIASDARTLSSGTPQEEAYAVYANKLKSLANQARKEAMAVEEIPYSPSARATYKTEYDSLDYKLNQALLNSPRERQAQAITSSIMKAKRIEEPSMTSERDKKLSQQELQQARIRVGAKRAEVKITPIEWSAIQAGAISKTRLGDIIANADLKTLRKLAMPRASTVLSASKVQRIKNMAIAGYTTSEIADSLGVSPSTISNYIKPNKREDK